LDLVKLGMPRIGSTALTIAATLAGGSVLARPVASGAHFKGEKLARLATLTVLQARAVALKARPGHVTAAELEQEKGGSGLRYSFDVVSRGQPFEVGVDARTGRVLQNDAEGRNPD
jgi:hypothetical protein